MSQLAREHPDDWQEVEHQMKEHGRVPNKPLEPIPPGEYVVSLEGTILEGDYVGRKVYGVKRLVIDQVTMAEPLYDRFPDDTVREQKTLENGLGEHVKLPGKARYRPNQTCDQQPLCGAEFHTRACPSFGRAGTGIDNSQTGRS